MVMKIDENWELVYDYQQTDNWDNKCVTVKIYNHKISYISQAILFDDVTKKTVKKIFSKETHESDAVRWANDTSNKIVYSKDKS